jgi:OOP family OmpA-OmpF porin
MKRNFTKVIALAALMTASASFTQAQEAVKTFGGKSQYRTWSIGINGGALAPVVLTGGSNDYTNWDANLGYGVNLSKQFTHSFSLQGNLLFGKLAGNNNDAPGQGAGLGYRSFETQIGYGADLRGVVNVATVDFLRRNNAVSFNVSLGYGLLAYAPSYVNGANAEIDWKGQAGQDSDKDYIKEAYVPVGVGVKFKVSNVVNFNLGYTMNFVDGDNLDARYSKSNDKFSYTSAGLEFTLGSKAKPSLAWSNPVATLYDELADDTLKQEVDRLKGRTTTVEGNVSDLKKDTDGDGVADHLDKCANTPAGIIVDGGGCPLKTIQQ